MGTFLWSTHHARPAWQKASRPGLRGELRLPGGIISRIISRLKDRDGWQIDDAFVPDDPNQAEQTFVLWQFAPRVLLTELSGKNYTIDLGQRRFTLTVEGAWNKVEHWAPKLGEAEPTPGTLKGVCSSAFRAAQVAPFLRLTGATGGSVLLRTILVAERP
jgi:hypothetical protein